MEKLSQEIFDFLQYRNTAGMVWLESEEGIRFLNSGKALPWLLSDDGRVWLMERGEEVWLRRGRQEKDREGCKISDYLTSEEGFFLLRNPAVLRWLVMVENGQHWFHTGHGANWLRSEYGQAWLRSDAGKKWMNVPKELLEK